MVISSVSVYQYYSTYLSRVSSTRLGLGIFREDATMDMPSMLRKRLRTNKDGLVRDSPNKRVLTSANQVVLRIWYAGIHSTAVNFFIICAISESWAILTMTQSIPCNHARGFEKPPDMIDSDVSFANKLDNAAKNDVVYALKVSDISLRFF